MNLGTIAYNKKIYNLDYMSYDEIDDLLLKIENDRNKVKKDIKKIIS